MTAYLGQTVLYKLSDVDADLIAQRRHDDSVMGNPVVAGEVYPATVVRTFGGGSAVNLQVSLDGFDNYWATSREEGTQAGTWYRPLELQM